MQIPFIERPHEIISESIYKIYYSDNKTEFDYFEKTPYFNIDFNSKNCFHMVWYFFTQEAIAYFLGLLIQSGTVENIVDDLSPLHTQFLFDFSTDSHINGVLRYISKKDSIVLLQWFTYLLEKSMNPKIREMLAKNFPIKLIRNIEYLIHFLEKKFDQTLCKT